MEQVSDVPLAWARRDFEQRLMFRGGRHTRVNTILAILLALLATIAFYGALVPFEGSSFADMFTRQGGLVSYAIVFFSAWSMIILFIKNRKIALQRKALKYSIVPETTDFILSAANVDEVVDRIYEIVDEPKYFVLYNRIVVALANLRNLGRVGDVGDILKSQAESDEAAAETSYGLVAGFVWAIPVLGFIGTVLGLSDAIGGFGAVLEQTDQMEQIKDALKDVTGGLSTAFITTLQALVAALIIQLFLTFTKKSEHEFLDECSQYCTNNIVNHLRIMPFERAGQEE